MAITTNLNPNLNPSVFFTPLKAAAFTGVFGVSLVAFSYLTFFNIVPTQTLTARKILIYLPLSIGMLCTAGIPFIYAFKKDHLLRPKIC